MRRDLRSYLQIVVPMVVRAREVSIDDFINHNRGGKEPDFLVWDEMYEEFGKLKLMRYGDWSHAMVITKGDSTVTDLRELSISWDSVR